jgi:hypothetical protein
VSNPNVTQAVFNILADVCWLVVEDDNGLIMGVGDTKELAVENAEQWVVSGYWRYSDEWLPDRDDENEDIPGEPMDIGDWIRTEYNLKQGTRRLGRAVEESGGDISYIRNSDGLLDTPD